MTSDADSATRRAAAAALGLVPDAPAGEARAAFLRRVEESRLVPPPLARAAAAELGVIPHGPEHRAVLDADVEADLAAAIERFADSYWDHASADRRTHWAELRAAAGRFPRLEARLDGLARGLDNIPEYATDDPTQARLADAVIELYPLKPAARARRRAQLVARIGDESTMRRSAQSLRRSCPDLEVIDHGLLEHLAVGRPAVRPLRAPRQAAVEAVAEPARASSGGAGVPHWVWIVCVLAVMGVVRVGSQVSKNLSSGSYSSTTQPSPLRLPAPQLGGAGSGGPTTNTGLTGAQLQILRALARRTELPPEEAALQARNFVTLGRLSAATGPKWNDRPPAVAPADPFFTLEQQRILERLARMPRPTETEVAELFMQFVKAGPPALRPPTVRE